METQTPSSTLAEKKIIRLANELKSTSSIALSPKGAQSFIKTALELPGEVKSNYQRLVKTVAELHYLTHEVEWIFNDFYIIEGALADIRTGVSKKEIRLLPFNDSASTNPLPRAYAILKALLNETGNEVGHEILKAFINSYQRRAPLTLRELAEMPMVLKIILVQSMNQKIQEITSSLEEIKKAQSWAQEAKLALEEEKPERIHELLNRLAKDQPFATANFAIALLERLPKQTPQIRPITKWLKLNLLKQGVDIKNLSQIEGARREKQINLVTNIINSLRWLNQVRWDVFVDEVNPLDKILAKDPVKAFEKLEAKSRLIYRRTIIELSDQTGIAETEIAKIAVTLAQKDNQHIGWLLLGKGRKALETEIRYTPPLKKRLYRSLLTHPSAYYFSALGVLTVMGALPLLYALTFTNPIGKIAYALLLLLLSSDLAITALNSVLTNLIPPKQLPRLDFRKGVPAEHATFIVVPTLLRSITSNKELIRKMEINYLGNQDEHIYYGLLLGFKDAPTQVMPDDAELVESLKKEIENLNKKYGATKKPRFFMFYQKRTFNASEGVYMEYERKRGKLRQFNQLMLGNKQTHYALTEKEYAEIPQVRYAITLDEDTQLPREAAAQLIGCIAHPLNQPVIHPKTNRITQGYGIIQPRVATPLGSATKSLFARLFSFAVGIDPYANVSADVYQDIFDSAIFFGKGIYDIKAIEKTMADSIPDNTVLSHDLLEGIYAKTGLATDIQVFDNFPTRYHEYILRLHRWIRGDWQITRWLKSKIKDAKGKIVETHFSFLDRWKIFDNLRRSLIPVAATLLLIISWLVHPNNLALPIYIALILAAPFLIPALTPIFQRERHLTIKEKTFRLFREIGMSIAQTIVRQTFILYQAIMTVDAIIRSLIRQLITKKHLLQWRAAQEVGQKLRGGIFEFYRAMILTQPITLFVLWLLIKNGTVAMTPYTFIGTWFLSPLIAYTLSTSRDLAITFSNKEKQTLRKIAAKTIRYFIELSTKEHNWLIPDHFQEEPRISSQSTTSPTNLGALLMSLVSARDFGYLGIAGLNEKIGNSLTSIAKLDRFKGHLYNWYDIEALKATSPQYVSTVDSANFLIALIAVRQGLLSVANEPIIRTKDIEGLLDLCGVIEEECAVALKKNSANKQLRLIIKHIQKQTGKTSEKIKKTIAQSNQGSIEEALKCSKELLVEIASYIEKKGEPESAEKISDIIFWTEHLETIIADHEKTIKELWGYKTIGAEFPEIYLEQASAAFKTAYKEMRKHLASAPTIGDLNEKVMSQRVAKIENEQLISTANLTGSDQEKLAAWTAKIKNAVSYSERKGESIYKNYQKNIALCTALFEEADFSFLYNKERGLFHIGYNQTFNKIDNSYYDFLASEANLASFVAILKNQVPQKHWFYLGRKSFRTSAGVSLISWGGSLFEYLTSLIFLDPHPESVLGACAKTAVSSHMRYAKKFKIPWGMGESGFNLLDLNQNYQYQIFGVPELGLKRGLGDYLVVAPYTTALSLRIAPQKSVKNLKRLIKEGVWGRYGFYDAIDYTTTTGKRAKYGAPVKTHYAHHQGFVVASLTNAVFSGRIHSLMQQDLLAATGSLLLEEKMPTAVPLRPITPVAKIEIEPKASANDAEAGQYIPLKTEVPRYAIIGNTSYTVGVSNSGAGWSKLGNIALTRFKSDPTTEQYGSFIYLREQTKEMAWSPTHEPIKSNKKKTVIFSENKAEFEQTTEDIKTNLTVVVHPTQNVEMRNVRITNEGDQSKKIELITYSEVSLALPDQDLHHSAFQKLFVKAEFDKKLETLIFSRHHPQNRKEQIYFAHLLVQNTKSKEHTDYQTSREMFLGRHGDLKSPRILTEIYSEPQKEYPLDPIASLKKTITVPAKHEVDVLSIYIAAHNREELLKLIAHYRNGDAFKEFTIAKQNNIVLRQLNMSAARAMQYQEIASHLISGVNPQQKPLVVDTMPAGNPLWKYGISGVLPLLILKISDIADISFAKQVLQCRRYLHAKGVSFDLVILNEQPTSYIKTLHDEIDFLMRSLEAPNEKGELGRVFHIKADLIPAEDNQALVYAASVQLDSKQGTFESQLASQSTTQSLPPHLEPVTKLLPAKETPILRLPKDLKFFNGFGGFDQEHNEYVITTNDQLKTPAPWTNIVANEEIGFVVSESGSSFTWAGDSYDNRLTRWSNDPLLDHSGEAIYLRDEESGEFWSTTPLPVQTKGNYVIRHGLGYSSFEHAYQGIHHTTTLIVPIKDSIKIYDVQLKNTSSKPRTISLTGYFEPSLGVHRQHTKNLLKIERDTETKALTVKNIYRSNAFQSTLLFIDMNQGEFKATNDREEFIGRGQSMKNPAALSRTELSDTIKTGVDTCAAVQSKITLLPGETKTIQAFLGQAENIDEVRKRLKHYRSTYSLEKIKDELTKYWQQTTKNIQIKTPDEQLDALINYRLVYQAITSRLVAKTGYYQPSGAFGFRDQLQDSLALIHAQPERTKEMILKAAAHQCKEGDAQNWWHEHNDFGVRTITTDHQIWLPYVTANYIDATNEKQLLDLKTPFLESPVPHFEDYPEWAGIPQKTEETYTLYENCLRAIKKTAQLGTHNLPLIGKSDWNDGLSNVGTKGKGESVWLGWLLYAVSKRFIQIAQERNDEPTLEWLTQLSEKLEAGLERHAWDGSWYKRAYFDSGAPLGSHRNKEYRIDSIVQSWAVLGGGKREDRIKKALSSAVKQLVDPVDQIVRLINPPVIEGSIDPGYLKDYPAGVRENGAQYNHAALWLSQALLATGNADQAKMILDFVNPLKRTETSEDVKRYRAEPYVLASDIYAEPSYPGRGGWTWYTGSAGVFYRTVTEYVFGISIKEEILTINPSIPRDWKEARLTLIHKNITYQINIQNPYQATRGVAQTKLNGKILTENKIHLTNNQKTNTIEILLAPQDLQ